MTRSKHQLGRDIMDEFRQERERGNNKVGLLHEIAEKHRVAEREAVKAEAKAAKLLKRKMRRKK